MKRGKIVYYHYLVTDGWFDEKTITEVKKYKTSSGDHEILQPTVIKCYKTFMNAIDVCDHVMSNGDLRIHTNKWIVKMFCYVLRLALYNGRVLFNALYKPEVTFTEFTELVAEHFKNEFVKLVQNNIHYSDYKEEYFARVNKIEE